MLTMVVTARDVASGRTYGGGRSYERLRRQRQPKMTVGCLTMKMLTSADDVSDGLD